MIAFIVIPNNKGLANYVAIALQFLGNPGQDKIVVSRGEDIPFIIEKLTQKGRNAIGLTGSDLFKEYELSTNTTELKILKTINWKDKKAKYGKPVLCLLGPKGKKLEDGPKNLKVSINAKYKNIAGEYLCSLDNKGYNFVKIYLSGSTESTCCNGISDVVIDIVYTGSSVVNANLEVYDMIFESDFVIIGVEKNFETVQSWKNLSNAGMGVNND